MGYKSNLQLPDLPGRPAIAAVTLAATAKALYAAGDFPVIGDNWFDRVGRKMKLHLFGKMTTAATPGNGTMRVYWGSGADASGTILAATAALALAATQTDLSWSADIDIFCVTVGATGSLFCSGVLHFNTSLISSTLQPILLPASAPVAVGSLDLTAAGFIPSVQYLRSGSTAETMEVVDLDVITQSSGRQV